MRKSKLSKLLNSAIFNGSIILILLAFIISNSLFEGERKEPAKLISKASYSSSISNLMESRPLRFIPNMGQAGAEAKYHVQGAGHTVLFHQEKVVLRRTESGDKKNEIVLEFKNANKSPKMDGKEKMKGVANFFKGSSASNWQTNVPTYGSVVYEELYPGIDMHYIGKKGKLESEFYVSSNVDYHQIQIKYNGVKSKKIRDDGALVLETELGNLVEGTPYVYQEINGEKLMVEAEYTIHDDESVGFELGDYDPASPVVIDPELVFLTVVESITDMWGSGVVIDNNGDLIVGGVASRFFKENGGIEGSNHSGGLGNDGLVLKIDGTSGEVIWSALFGGTKGDVFNDIAIDTLGAIYLTGYTESTDFPVMNAAQETLAGKEDALLVILNSSLELVTSTYLGGDDYDLGEAIAVNDSGNVYVGGRTLSTDFPVKGGLQSQLSLAPDHSGENPSDLFVSKYNSSGVLTYSTYLGGTGKDRLADIAVDAKGEATIAGTSESADFPLKNAYQNTFGGGGFGEGDIVISRLNSNGNELVYSTYLGDNAADWASGISLGTDGSAIVAGSTSSTDFPIVNGKSFAVADESDGVLIMLDNIGQPVYSVRSNIAGWDQFVALAADDTIAYPLSSDGIIQIFEKSPTDSLKLTFEYEATGHNINGVYLKDGDLAFAATYWGTGGFGLTKENNGEKNGSISNALLSGAECSVCKVKLDQYFFYIYDGQLNISAKKGSDIDMKLGVNPEGFVTIDGVVTNIKAEDVKGINIKGNEKTNAIDLREVTRQNFPFIAEDEVGVKIDIGDSYGRETKENEWANLVFGSPDYQNWIIGGKGINRLWGGDNNDIIDIKNVPEGSAGIVEAQDGDDWIIATNGATIIGSSGKGNDKLILVGPSKDTENKSAFLPLADDYMILNDSLGIDTLDFSALETGITLDLTLQNEVQIIDSDGTKLMLQGIFEVIIGTDFDDEFRVSPLTDTAHFIDGRDGTDILNYVSNVEGINDGTRITSTGFAEVKHMNFETINLSLTTGIYASDISSDMLIGNFPNPFNTSTKIQYSIINDGFVSLKIYDVAGKEVETLVSKEQTKGNYEVDFNASGIIGGVYYYTLKSEGVSETKKMMILK